MDDRSAACGAGCVGLTKDNDDVFDEVMDCGEDSRAAFEGYSSNNNEREHDPRHEAND